MIPHQKDHDQGHDHDRVRKMLEETRVLAEQHLEGWKRAKADYANLKKEMEKERSQFVKFANATFIEELLPIVDNLDRAVQELSDEQKQQNWTKGIVGIHKQLHDFLQSVGVVRVEAHGAFNPELHEAVGHEQKEGAVSGHIIREVRPGYRLHDTLIRPAHVIVAQ